MNVLADYRDACGDLAVQLDGDPATPITGLTADSRLVTPGTLFVAIRGETRDGCGYIPEAIARGAVAVACRADVRIDDYRIPMLRLSDDYRGFGRLAECFYGFPSRSLQCFAVTGTNGKTTTAFLLRDIFRHAQRRVGLLSTVHYEIETDIIPADRTTPMPLELQSMLAQMRDRGLDTMVAETSSHALDQGRLGALQVKGAVFTNLSGDHLDYHKDMQAYMAAKRRLFFDHLAPGAVCSINLDDPAGRALARDLSALGRGRDGGRLIGYTLGRPGSGPDMVDEAAVTVCLKPIIRRMDLRGTDIELTWLGRPLWITTPLTGEYNVQNVVGAVGLALAAGIDPVVIAEAMAAFTGVPGRLQRVPADPESDLNVFVDYAHTDDALTNVLGALRPLCTGRLVCLFGAGGNRDATKRPRMAKAAAMGADYVVVTSDNPRRENPQSIVDQIVKGLPRRTPHTVIVDRAEAIQQAIAQAQPGDTLLLAGKGHEDYQEIDGVKHPFLDLTVAQEALAQRLASQRVPSGGAS